MYKNIWFKLLLAFFPFVLFAQPAELQKADSLGNVVVSLFQQKKFKEIEQLKDTQYLAGYNRFTFEADWNELVGTYGEMEKKKIIYFGTQNNYHFISYKIYFESLPYILNLGFTPENKMHYVAFIPAHKIYVYPDYADADKFSERELSITNGMYVLPGNFTSPYAKGKHPLVIILPDAGPTDRDGSYNENKPYKDLVGALTTSGYNTYRFEKRPNIYGAFLLRDKAAYEPYTCRDEYLDDLYKAIDTLSTLPEVDPPRVYILGHGQGGMLLPLVAKERADVKGIILLGANAKRTQEMMMDQFDYLAKVAPYKKGEYMEQKERAKLSMNKKLNPLTEHHLMPYDVQATYWIWFNNYKHIDIAKKIKQPMLILHADRDYQVNLENLAIWKKELGAKPSVTIKNYPALNHLFYSGGGESTYSEYFSHSNIPDYVIQDLRDWLSAH
jgi:hypothetical protein